MITGIGGDTKLGICQYWYQPILGSIGRYPLSVSV